MQYLRLFLQNDHFFHPKRLVWKEAEPKTETLKAKREEPSWEELMQTADFLEYAKETCDATREEGQEALECRIRSLKEGEEIVKFKRFIDELGEKFLRQLPEFKYRTAKETSKRFKLLQEVTDMQAIMTRFEEAENYEIKPYRRGKTPAIIIFEYPDGKTEEYPLELSTKQKHVLWGTIGEGARESLKKEGVAEVRARGKFERKLEEMQTEVLQGTEGSLEKLREEMIQLATKDRKKIKEAQKKLSQDAADRAKKRETPGDVYSMLLDLKNKGKISANFPEDLLEELSQGPFYEINKLLRETGGDFTNITDEQRERGRNVLDDYKSIIASYYGIEGEDPLRYLDDNAPQVLRDLNKILGTFGII